MSAKRILVLGGGTAGTMTANRLRRQLDTDEAEICVVDRDDRHIYQPGLLFVPFGMADPGKLVRSRRRQLRAGIDFVESEVDAVQLDEAAVTLADGSVRPYDVLVVASGVELQPEETEGLRLVGDGAHLLRARARDRPSRGFAAFRRRPPRRRHRRHADQVPGRAHRALVPGRLVAERAWPPRAHRAHPRDAARRLLHQADRLEAPRPTCSRRSRSGSRSSSAQARWTARVDGSSPTTAASSASICSWPCRSTAARPTSPARPASATRSASCPTDPHTLQAHARPNVFALGDATDLPTSKAGSGAHFQSELLERQRPPLPRWPRARRRLRRPRQLLRRDRPLQGAADRLQLRPGARAGALPGPGRSAAPPRVAARPPRQARLRAPLLARAPPGPPPARDPPSDAASRQANPRRRRGRKGRCTTT